MSDEKKTGRAALDEINARLGGLLGALGETLGEALAAAEKGERSEVIREHVIETPNGPLQARAGLRLRLGGLAAKLDEAPRAPGRDPTRPVNRPADTQDPAPRLPDLEVDETPGHWALTAELPGVARADLVVNLTGGRLVIETIGKRRYRAAVPAPAGLTLDAVDIHLSNGILEIRQSAPAGEPEA